MTVIRWCRGRRWRRCYLGLVTILLLANTGHSHEGRPIYLELTQTSTTGFSLQWKIPPVMAAGEVPRIKLADDVCTMDAGQSSTSLMGKRQYHCDIDAELTLILDYPGVNPVLSSLVVLRRLNGATLEFFNGPAQRRITLPQEMTPVKVAQQYLLGGGQHILAGYDHLLFIVCLMIITGLGRRLFIAITGFTLAHSVTLALASLGIVRLWPPLVEALIALSIALLAAEIINNKRHTLAWRYPLSIACAFGLLHGFGFASVLADLGLPDAMQINALVFFNIGIELGQLAFMLAVLTISTLLIRSGMIKALLPQATVVGAYAAGSISIYWLIDALAAAIL